MSNDRLDKAYYMENKQMESNHLVSTTLPTKYGEFEVKAYEYRGDGYPNLALHTSDLNVTDVVDVRIHSECMTGDVFGSSKCDCGEQLEYSMEWVQKNGGVIIYLRQEGRGIGLVNKLHAYNLQRKGFDTLQANLELGFHADQRDYTPAIAILKDLKISKIRLLTNNPLKLEAFNESGIKVTDRLPIEIKPHDNNIDYMRTKKNDMGHLINSKLI